MVRKIVFLGIMVVVLGVGFTLQNEQSVTRAQSDDEACDVLVENAIEKIANSCVNLGRNEVCYGNEQVSAVLKEDDLFFEAAGDIVPLAAIETIITRPADPDSDEWGIALMDVQADLPNDVDGSVRMVMFGGVEIAPTVETPTENIPTCEFSNFSFDNINMRTGPGLNYRSIDVLDAGDSVLVYGTTADGEWVRSARGWLSAPLGSLFCEDEVELMVMDSVEESFVAPMQAFTMQVDDEANCETAPSGLLVQTPSGQTANIMVNNVQLRIGSTAFITMQEAEMTIANYGGNVDMTSEGVTWLIPEGGQANVTIEDGAPTEPPRDLESIDGVTENVDPRLIGQLPETLSVPEPFEFPDELTQEDNTTETVSTRPGEWGACGSCDTCGYTSEQCVTSPDGQCVWDPGYCAPPPAVPTLSVPMGLYLCDIQTRITVPVTYSAPDGATIVEYGAFSDFSGILIVSTPSTSATTFDITIDCATPGIATITASVYDSSDRDISTSFSVHSQ